MKHRTAFGLCFIGLIITFTGLVCIDQASALDVGGEELGVTFDFTYASKYLWHGIDVFNDHGAYQPAVMFNFRNYFAGVWGSWPAASGSEGWKELDLFIGFTRPFFEEETFAVNTKFDYWYVSHPSTDSNRDVQQLSATFSMPNMFPIGPSSLVPSYSIFHISEGIQKEKTINNGWFQTLGLSYDFPISPLLPDQEKQAITASWDINFNDGVFGGDSGLSHSTLKLSTAFVYGRMYLIPSINYQWSFLETVNREDDFYFTIGMGYRF